VHTSREYRFRRASKWLNIGMLLNQAVVDELHLY
jgi:hypothetical protein